MKIKILLLTLCLFQLSCIQKIVQRKTVVDNPTTPFKAASEVSPCFTDRATYDGNGQKLKSKFIESTASSMAKRHRLVDFEYAVRDCLTVNGTGRQVILYFCSQGSTIKDHYCHTE